MFIYGTNSRFIVNNIFPDKIIHTWINRLRENKKMYEGTLLIVDDDELVLNLLNRVLEQQVSNIITALDGTSAIEIIRSENIHCVICDIAMPDISGVELLKIIRENNMEVPFIFYTSHSDKELMMEALKYGAFDFLIKPNLDGLKDVVKNGLEKGFQKVPIDKNSQFISEYKRLLEKIDS